MRSGVIARMLGPLLAGLSLWAGAAPASEASLADLARARADVILIGEVHDNPEHHANQAALVAALRPRALVFEMFGPEAALRVRPEIRGDARKLEQALGWEALGWPDFGYYHAIFLAAPDAAIFGGALPRDTVRAAVKAGAAATFGDGAPLFGLDAALDPEEAASREALQARAHCDALPGDLLPGMVEAQRLRDAALSRAVVAAFAETGGPVVVIAGNGHVRTDWGMPRMLARALPEATLLSIGQLETAPDAPPPYDRWLVTAGVPDRDDPCGTFAR